MTALYSSVFFVATFADARSKDKRRAEWEEKIAAVNKQVCDLVDEEQRILESLSRPRRPIKGYNRWRVSPKLFPVRHYSTTNKLATSNSLPLPREDLEENIPLQESHSRDPETSSEAVGKGWPILDERPLESSAQEESLSQDLEDYSEAVENELDRDDSLTAEQPVPTWVMHDERRLQAIQMLALKQLAVRLLLRPSVAHNYEGVQMNYSADFRLPRLNIPTLFAELNIIRRKIRHLKEDSDLGIDGSVRNLPLYPTPTDKEKNRQLDVELQQDIELCYQDQMSLEELLLRASNNLMESATPDRTRALRLLVTVFSKLRQNDVVHLILKAILPNYFHLRTSLIICIITFFRRAKDLKNFDLFLQMLRGGGYPLNLRHLPPYKLEDVNGVKVTVPPLGNHNIIIFSSLITAALRFNQPERADAWLCVVRRSGFMDNFTTLHSYLRFYKLRNDWEKGVNVLRRALAFMVSSVEHPQRLLERLIVLMVQLCDSCDQFHVSDELINAYLTSGFDPESPKRQLDCTFKSDPTHKRWVSMPEHLKARGSSVAEKCSTFVNIIGQRGDELFSCEKYSPAKQRQKMMTQFSQGVLSSTLHDASARNPTESYHIRNPAAQEDMQNHSKQLKSLQDEVTRLKELVSQLKPATNP